MRIMLALLPLAVACGAADVNGDGLAHGNGSGGDGANAFDQTTAKGDGTGNTCAAVVAPTQKAQADIIFVIDNSTSMTEEMAQVRENVNRFADRIGGVGVDYRVLMLVRKVASTFFDSGICVPEPLAGPDCDDRDPRFFHIDMNVGSRNSLDAILATYDGSPSLLAATYDNFGKPIPHWKDHLRADATKVFVEVTDDESAVTADTFDKALLAKGMFGTAKQRKYVFHSIVSKPAGAAMPSSEKCATAAGTSLQYQKLSQLTGGIVDEVCKTDYSEVMDNIAGSIVDKVGCELAYPKDKATDSTKVVVRMTLDGQKPADLTQVTDGSKCASVPNAWYYDVPGNPSKMVLCPTTCTNANKSTGTKIEALLGCSAPAPR